MSGMIFLLLHFSLVALQNTKLSDKTKLFYIVKAYDSFFHQSWNLFVPPPTVNYSLFITQGNGPPATDVFREITLTHQQNRLAGYEPLALAFSNSIFYFEKNTRLQDGLNGPVKNDLNFTMIEHAAENYMKQVYHLPAQQPKLILVAEDVLSKKKRVYFN